MCPAYFDNSTVIFTLILKLFFLNLIPKPRLSERSIRVNNFFVSFYFFLLEPRTPPGIYGYAWGLARDVWSPIGGALPTVRNNVRSSLVDASRHRAGGHLYRRRQDVLNGVDRSTVHLRTTQGWWLILDLIFTTKICLSITCSVYSPFICFYCWGTLTQIFQWNYWIEISRFWK